MAILVNTVIISIKTVNMFVTIVVLLRSLGKSDWNISIIATVTSIEKKTCEPTSKEGTTHLFSPFKS